LVLRCGGNRVKTARTLGAWHYEFRLLTSVDVDHSPFVTSCQQVTRAPCVSRPEGSAFFKN
ncbi:MAG TPA: hypothetical protein VFM77_18820, partial [Terriglobales bacterium]|nr:hypothetical protein [Terriglobales bacterium]